MLCSFGGCCKIDRYFATAPKIIVVEILKDILNDYIKKLQ
jgi:hypothetical protein